MGKVPGLLSKGILAMLGVLPLPLSSFPPTTPTFPSRPLAPPPPPLDRVCSLLFASTDSEMNVVSSFVLVAGCRKAGHSAVFRVS